MNVQFAIQDDEVYVLEVNPRASRTVPFVSKAIGVPLGQGRRALHGWGSLADQGFEKEIVPPHVLRQGGVFPFSQVPRRRHPPRPGDEVHR
jgi:carbamoyl-phosphate synthase large subunit